MSSSAPSHAQSMNSNDEDFEFYKMVEVRLSHFNKYGEDHPDYVPKLDDNVCQQQLLPATDFAVQGGSVPLVMNEALLTPDLNKPQRSILNAGIGTASAQVKPAGRIEGGAQLYHGPPVVELTGDQHYPSFSGTGDERLVNASSATPIRVEHIPKTKSRIDNQFAEGKCLGNSNAKYSQKGEVRDSPTGLGIEYMDPRTGVWLPAVRHADIRVFLLEESEHIANLYGGYDFPPAEGFDKTDKTAFVPKHKTWGPDRPNRPEINFVFDRPTTPLPINVRPNTQPNDWVWHGFIVLDHNDKLMRSFDDCPTTLASCVEGFRIDAILKRNPQMETMDLWGRLPPCHTTIRHDMSLKVVPIVTIAGLNNVAMRWRYEACVLSFLRRSDDTKDFLRQFLTPQQLKANTTRGREDLTKSEVAELFEYKKAAESARKKKQAPPKLIRRFTNVEAPPVVSPDLATTAQATAPVEPLMSHAEWVKKVLNNGAEYRRVSAAGLRNDQVKIRGQKRQFVEAIDSRDLKVVSPENSDSTARDRAALEYRPILPLKHGRRTLQTSVNEDVSTNYLSPEGQGYLPGRTNALINSPSLGTVEGPPAKKRWAQSRVNGNIAQVPQVRQIERAQGGRTPGLDINSSAGPNTRYDGERTLRPPSRHSSPNGGQIEYAYPDRRDSPPKNRKIVPPGFRHEIYPIGLRMILFCPDETVVRQGIIKANEKTAWQEEKIPNTIRTLREMDPSQKLSHLVPSEIFRKAQTSSNTSMPTEAYTHDVPEGFEPFNYPIGKKVICVFPGAKKIFGAVIAAAGQSIWQRLSAATTISLLKDMEERRESHQQGIAEALHKRKVV